MVIFEVIVYFMETNLQESVDLLCYLLNENRELLNRNNPEAF